MHLKIAWTKLKSKELSADVSQLHQMSFHYSTSLTSSEHSPRIAIIQACERVLYNQIGIVNTKFLTPNPMQINQATKHKTCPSSTTNSNSYK